MTTQSEEQLENKLIQQLVGLGFERTDIKDKKELEGNLKTQLEKFNNTSFSDSEFQRILIHLNKGDRFNKAETLRDRYILAKDNEEKMYIKFFNSVEWCKNEYQVASQITQEGKYTNRYDVTLLINGLPLIQIELKRKGLEMKEAFNQIDRYHAHSFPSSLFEYIQIFVISNGVNTKYFANYPGQKYDQAFYWTDSENKKITLLEKFTESFLEKCTVSEIIAEYIVLAQANRQPLILRPYQVYAAKAIERRVKESKKNGYIWHTTGSGKTLTSFKTAQTLRRIPEVKKVLFVVDRKDLDFQTKEEFESYSKGSVDNTESTQILMKQLADTDCDFILTTIQKLDRAINKDQNRKQFSHLENAKIVIIFDECHRSHFGETHKRIEKYFTEAQLFGFTGTPILDQNNNKGRTTKDLFDECLHKYTITDAISDGNVLGFAVEHYQTFKDNSKEMEKINDVMVSDIDREEPYKSQKHIDIVTNHILKDWKRKTKRGKYNALFAISSIESLKKYYTTLKQKKEDNFKIATIFSYTANEERPEEDPTDGSLDQDVFPKENQAIDTHSRDFLEECISDYNEMYDTNYTTNIFYEYYQNLQKRIKDKEVDLVLVVNIFLTGFDAKRLNTLYIDKCLKWHGLIQAYSRTNRTYGNDKPHGNIVSFRPGEMIKNQEDALRLYGGENAEDIVIKEPYEILLKQFRDALEKLREIAPTPDSVNSIKTDKEKESFIKAFRDVLRSRSVIETYKEFSFEDVGISEQEFYDFQSKYLDLYEERKKSSPEKESILNQLDFDVELVAKDIINHNFILSLLQDISTEKDISKQKKQIENLMIQLERDLHYRKKKDLIREFIDSKIINGTSIDIRKEYQEFWSIEKEKAITELSTTYKMKKEPLTEIIGEYTYRNKMPKDQEIVDALEEQPELLQRKPVIEKIKEAIRNIIDIFDTLT